MMLRPSIIAAAANQAGGTGSYAAQAVQFAAHSQLSRTLPDTALISGSFWINQSTGAFDGDGWLTAPDNGNAFELSNYHHANTDMRMNAATEDAFWGLDSPPGQVAPEVWQNVLFSLDLNHPAGEKLFNLYIGENEVPPTISDTSSAFEIPFSINPFNILGSITPDITLLADVWITTTHYIDFGDSGSRAKFHAINGKPLSLGTDGTLPFGYQPEIFFSGDAAAFGANRGTAGAFTLTGSLTDASTSPSD